MQIGQRVALKAPTINGWTGQGTIVGFEPHDDGALLLLAKNGKHRRQLVKRALNGEAIFASDEGVVLCHSSDLDT